VNQPATGLRTTTDRDREPAASPATRGAIELTDVTKAFDSVIAVDDLSLSIQPGEFLSLLGPSGCGKTTTLRILAGFEQPDAGRVVISGVDVAGTPPHRRDVNTVFQHYALFPHMTVAGNVAYGLRQKGVGKAEIRARVAEALDMVKMTAMANRRPRQLSGGQQQRVALARALINRPSVLLLDEPLGSLDRKLREDMQIELKLLQTQLKTTFVFVTHDQGEALSMSDRIAVMLDGRIEQLGTPDAIYDHPASAFVAGFIGQQNFFRGTAEDAGATVRAGARTLHSARPAPGVAHGAAVLAAVRPECVQVTQTAPGDPVNHLEGTLASTSHLGDTIQYLVVTADGDDVVARAPRSRAPRVTPGSRVWCRWTPEDVHVFPDEGPGPERAEPATPVVMAATEPS
jgi:spermidine/putrescine transport system ATP-binding protein